MNEWAETSRWTGICSLLPYLLAVILSQIERRTHQTFFEAGFILGLFCFFWGILVGSATLIIGVVAIQQIHNGQNTEKGIPSAVLGIVLGAAALVSNILFIFMLVYAITFA
jgi:hypothetical protein